MRTRQTILAFLLGLTILCPLDSGHAADKKRGPTALSDPQPQWQRMLAERLRAYGHRNWIVIADSAYPAQTSPGIETVVTEADQLAVLRAVLDEVGHIKHVRPSIYLDAELPLIAEADAPGVGKYREQLKQALVKRSPRSLPHEKIIARLDEAGRTYKILVLKTNLTIPYTSVFVELDCGYWSPEAERRLREAMKSRDGAPER